MKFPEITFRIRFLAVFVMVLFLGSGSSGIAQTGKGGSSKKPNIILVMADDQGWGDTGYNGHPVVRTPAMDQMAKNGLVFDRFYAGAPVCSPTRASVLTGRSPIRTKVTNHGRYMRPHEFTIAKDLKKHGYKTGIFGKFHLGSGQPTSPCNPGAMGFDQWVIGLNFFDNNPYLSRNGKVEKFQGRGSVIAMTEALRFLEANKDHSKPLFTVIWFPAPHLPHKEKPDLTTSNRNDESKEVGNLYAKHKNRGYFNEITLIDQQLGRLQASLKRMKMDEETILWYCSDNGGLLKASSGGRAKKGSIYEGGLRVPSVIQWPSGQLKGNCKHPVSTVDIYPTLMSMIGETPSTDHPLDGQDVSGLIKGTENKRKSSLGFWHLFQQGQATHSDRILKDIAEKQANNSPVPHNQHRMKKDVDQFPQFPENKTTGHAAWLDWPWKLHRIQGNKYELYNLEKDPMERNDLSSNLEHEKRLEKMKAELNAWMKSVVRSINGKDYRSKVH